MIRNADESCVQMNIVQLNIFDLPDHYENFFDIVIEYTCFCAISPERRFEYDRVVWQLLKPEGKLLGLFLPLDKNLEEGGPPWGVSIMELHKLFSLHWELESEEMPRESIDRRADREVLMVWRKK